jgi:hypothetical protein
MRRLVIAAMIALVIAGASLLIPDVRSQVRAIVRPEPPAQITPLAVTLPQRKTATTERVTPTKQATASSARTATPTDRANTSVPRAVPSPAPPPSPTSEQVIVNGRVYAAYIPAATKEKQAYQYSCEFDAAWVILQTYGIDASVDDLIATVGVDRSIEPYIKKTNQGTLIYGGDITTSFSGDLKENFLARSTGVAMRKAFERYDLRVAPVSDRAGIEKALRVGQLVWIKTTVDFKSWRPATWVMPDGRTIQTVLGNDHAVVVMGFNDQSVVIRDVLGPTSSNWKRPYEYEVDWDTFLKAWGAQEFDGLAVAPPQKS